VNNSASSLSTGELIASLAAFWIVYLGLITAWVHQIVREVRRGPDALPGLEGGPGTAGPVGALAGAGQPVTAAEA
jgi:cytochrome bd-type quinol oxidase subunit 1